MRFVFFTVFLAVLVGQTLAADYVRLRDGRLISGAVIRQDTLAIYLSPWEQRHMRQPELQVFARNEVESIWLGSKPHSESLRRYKLRPGLIELGGGLSMQTWAASVHERRFLSQISLQGGYAITKYLGTELIADFTLPKGKKSDAQFDSLKFGYQVALHVVGMLDLGRSWIPFAYAGGGSALDVPRGTYVQTTGNDVRSLLDIGAGIKAGLNGLGIRAEIRHAYYTWTPDRTTEEGTRLSSQNADATTMRLSLFTYF
ncbi:MAG: hypothetical protein H6506_03740 [Calditrichaeota bacterium]|nr:hypothetical protein [Calditrichota bacterium]MCB9391745.1 hypothetical protein [Calditrichota bacterium]